MVISKLFLLWSELVRSCRGKEKTWGCRFNSLTLSGLPGCPVNTAHWDSGSLHSMLQGRHQPQFLTACPGFSPFPLFLWTGWCSEYFLNARLSLSLCRRKPTLSPQQTRVNKDSDKVSQALTSGLKSATLALPRRRRTSCVCPQLECMHEAHFNGAHNALHATCWRS